MRARSSTVAALCLVSAIGSAARADDEAPPIAFELAGNTVIVRSGETETNVKVGCRPRSFASTAAFAYALCSPNVIVVVAAAPLPHVQERRALAQPIVSLTVRDGAIFARSDTGLKPLSEYRVAVSGETPGYEDTLTATPKRPARKPAITGPELSVLGTAGVGVDAIPGPFAFLDAAAIERFPFGLSLAAYGTFGAATGEFQTGSRDTGPFGGDVQIATGEAHIGFDTRYFAFSLGSGAAMTDHGYNVEPVFAIRGRAGEVDGFTIAWHTAFVAGPNAFGVFGGVLEFPVTRRLWFGVDAELGNLRYGRFMVDVRHRLSSKEEHSTLDLRASIGLAYVHSGVDCQSNTIPNVSQGDTVCLGTNAEYLGPAISLGLLWRP
jgi:hypothetical protein